MQKTVEEVKVIAVRRLDRLSSEVEIYNIDTWLAIFADVFGEKPVSIEDERWNTLLNQHSDIGYGALGIAINYFDSLKQTKRAG